MTAPTACSPAHLDLAGAAHRVVLYTDEQDLFARLASLLGPAVVAGDPVLLVTTPAHFQGVETALIAQGTDPAALRAAGRYLELDATEALADLLIGERIEPHRLRDLVSRSVAPWCLSGEHVHVYGSLVNLLWDRGLITAALDLEAAWNQAISSFGFDLLCGYPDQAFAVGPGEAALAHVCQQHSEVIRQPARAPEDHAADAPAGAVTPPAIHVLVDRLAGADVEVRVDPDEDVIGVQRLLDALDGQVAVLDADGRVLAANAAWAYEPPPIAAAERAIAQGIAEVAAGVVARFACDHLVDTATATAAPRLHRLTATRFPDDGPVRLLLRCEDVDPTPR